MNLAHLWNSWMTAGDLEFQGSPWTGSRLCS